MALRVGLPLNGNINNYGISDVAVTNNGATVDSSGKIGSCYSFDGNTKCIDLVSNTINNCLTGGQQPFSLTMGVYHGDARRAILFGDWSMANSIGVNFELTTGHAVRFYGNGSPDKYFSAPLSISTGNNIAITYDGTKVNYYLNGEYKDNYTGTLAVKNKSSGAVGRVGRDSRTTDTALNGKLNDVRLYDHCLSPKEVKEISKGLCLHYKLDGVCNTIDNIEGDCSGFGNNGTKHGTFTQNTNSPRYSSSLDFTGSQYIAAGKTAKITDTITVSGGGYMSNWGNYTRAISCTEGGGWNFELSNGKIQFIVFKNGAYLGVIDTIALSSYSAGWHHFSGTYDGYKSNLYIDGILKATSSATTTKYPIVYNSNNGIFVGAEAGSDTTTPAGNYFNGSLSDIRIYATALSDVDIKELYNTSLSIDNVGNMYTYEFKEIE